MLVSVSGKSNPIKTFWFGYESGIFCPSINGLHDHGLRESFLLCAENMRRTDIVCTTKLNIINTTVLIIFLAFSLSNIIFTFSNAGLIRLSFACHLSVLTVLYSSVTRLSLECSSRCDRSKELSKSAALNTCTYDRTLLSKSRLN